MADRARTWANVERFETYREIVAAHLRAVHATVPTAAETACAQQIDLVSSALGSWADEPVERFDHHHSFTANDGSPVEFSYAMSRSAAEARVLFEPLDTTQDPPLPRQAGRHFVDRLERVPGVEVDRYRRVVDLFAGVPTTGDFSMLCSAELKPGKAPLFKAYLNPAIDRLAPHEVVGEAMSRLGLDAQWAMVADELGVSGPGRPRQKVALFALDLGNPHEARVKVYFRHTGGGTEEAEQIARLGQDYRPDLFAKIIDRCYGGSVDRLPKALMTCLAFRENQGEPDPATLYCPLDPNVGNDAEAVELVVNLLEMSGIGTDRFRTLATTISGTDPAAGRRLSWLSYKRPADPVVTIYAGLDGSRTEPA